jgi:PEP-CTERM motif
LLTIVGKRFFSQEGLYMKGSIVGFAGFIVLFVQAGPAKAGLITNGGFETGTFSSWTVTDQAGGGGSWYVSNSTDTPNSGHISVGPASGTYYAVSDQSFPGAHALIQSFTVPANSTVTLTFDMFVNNYDNGPFIGPLDYTGASTAQGRVDILRAGASAFDTGTGVIRNLYDGADGGPSNGGPPPDPYIHYSFNITPYVGQGGTFQLRFAESDNVGYVTMGVDNVSITASAVPEPATLVLTMLGVAMTGLAGRDWRQRRAPTF